MHDVLDPRDLVPDEAQQLLHSGFPTQRLLSAARAAVDTDDLVELARIDAELEATVISTDWPYAEPSDSAVLIDLLGDLAVLDYDRDQLADRIEGAWLGRCVANTLGKPIEGLTRLEVETYLKAVGQWPQVGYVPLLPELPEGVSHLHESAPFSAAGTFTDVPRDDDLDWTILGLLLSETYGDELSTEQIAAEWLDRLPFTQTFTAERAAYRNLIRGLPVTETAATGNPYREWIGALIRADIFGYTHPGDRREAARLALVDARLSHVANGVYGEMWAAALVSSAFTTDSAAVALALALPVVPHGSRLFEALSGISDFFETGATSTEAIDWAERNYGHYNWVHTINNAVHIAIGLLWGQSFIDAVAITISAGADTDSAGATVGSVYGALHGRASIPASLVGATHVHVRSAVRDFDRITITDLAARTVALVTQAERATPTEAHR